MCITIWITGKTNFFEFWRKFVITPRLKCIIDHTKKARIADIGTDHAYIPIYLIENNMAKYVIASDVKQGPVDIAENNIKKHSLEDKIEVRLGSGLSILKRGETEEIIIAGMGGKLIAEIIKNDIDIARECSLVLQPMNDQYELRKFLILNNFMITSEDIATEGFKVYNIINAKAGIQEEFENDIEYHLPKYLKNNINYKKLYEKKHREFKKVITGLENSKNTDIQKLNIYKHWLKELEKYEG